MAYFFAHLSGNEAPPLLNFGGGTIYKVGGAVSEPLVLTQPEPEFNEYARTLMYAGVVQVGFVVDRTGHPVSLDLVKPIGLGLDEVAVEAVRRYTFARATYQGRAVPVRLAVEVNFQILP